MSDSKSLYWTRLGAIGTIVGVAVAIAIAYVQVPSIRATLSGKTEVRRTLSAADSVDVWTTSVFSYEEGGGGPGGGRDDDELRVGGWGDEYVALVRFPIRESASRVYLELHNASGADRPTPVILNAVLDDWTFSKGEHLPWAKRPRWRALISNAVEVPTEGSVQIDITSWYEDVRLGRRPNYGLALTPAFTDNRSNRFASIEHSDVSKRPALVVHH